jgi:hypothetical protein
MAEGSRRRRRQRRSPSEWAALIRRFENSSVTVLEFCVQQDLGLSTFNRWRNRFRRELDGASGSEAMSFVRLDPLIDADDPADVGSDAARAPQAGRVVSNRAGSHAVSTDSVAGKASVWDMVASATPRFLSIPTTSREPFDRWQWESGTGCSQGMKRAPDASASSRACSPAASSRASTRAPG